MLSDRNDSFFLKIEMHFFLEIVSLFPHLHFPDSQYFTKFKGI